MHLFFQVCKKIYIVCIYYIPVGFFNDSWVKNPPAMQEKQETRVQSLGWEDPLEDGMQSTPVVLLGASPGQRSLGATVQRVENSQIWLSD